MHTVFEYLISALFLFNVLYMPFMIGKERKPFTASDVVIVTGVNLFLVFGLLLSR